MVEALVLSTDSPQDTLALGRKLAALLAPGDILLLSGRLGSGKTLLAAGIAEGLGVSQPVVSPSFVLVKTYDGFVPVVHADLYRLGSTGEFEDLELMDLSRDGVLLVEWGNVMEQGVPTDHLLIEIEIDGPTRRTFRFVAKGDWDPARLVELSS